MNRLSDHPLIAERRLEALRHALGEIILGALIDPNILEIMVNPNGQILFDTHDQGRIPTQFTIGMEERERVIRLIADYVGEPVLPDDPRLSGVLPHTGERFQAMLPPISEGPTFCIRKKPQTIFTLDDYLNEDRLTPTQYQIIKHEAESRGNILISGGTSSGKTTLANAILALPAFSEHRTIIIEDTPELNASSWDQISLLTRKSPKPIKLADLIKDSLRLRPDRIIIGEMRDGESALETIKAWNTGHPGGLSTIHANNALSALTRLEDLMGEVVSQPPLRTIGQTINLIIHIGKTSQGRRVEQILRIHNHQGSHYETQTIA